MSTLDFERNAAFHDEIAPEYDSRLIASPEDTLARKAFQQLLALHVPAGATVLDFGCGTGIDALAYARQGYRVLAYDNSPGMVAELRNRCHREIADGTVTPYSLSYPAFLENLGRWPKPDVVTANFAVLNSIRDLPPLFEALHRHLSPGGWLLASVLNPLHWSKVKTWGWWRDAWRAPRGPRLHIRDPYASYLHFLPETLRAARGFHLVGRANAGAMVRYDEARAQPLYWNGPAKGEWLWHTPAYKLLGHFVFLVLRRTG